jgi:hypothetical protein
VSEPLVEVPEAVAGSWHDDAPAIAERALGQLRLTANDVDAARVAGEVLTACQLVDQHLELRAVEGRVAYTVGGVTTVSYATGDAPEPVVRAAVFLTVELYARKDATLGFLGQGPDAMRLSGNHLAGVASMLAPYREGWGIG